MHGQSWVQRCARTVPGTAVCVGSPGYSCICGQFPGTAVFVDSPRVRQCAWTVQGTVVCAWTVLGTAVCEDSPRYSGVRGQPSGGKMGAVPQSSQETRLPKSVGSRFSKRP